MNAAAAPARRIVFDGLNLGLAQGTGIATYTRMLARVAHELGNEVGVVYSTPFAPAKNPRLREIAFFDERRDPKMGSKLTVRRALNRVVDQVRYHFPVKPVPVELKGAVDARQFEESLPVQDRVFVARNLFANARTYFGRTGKFAELAFPERPDIFHCTYPLALHVAGACNLCTIHDLVPLRLPFATLDNKRRTFRLLERVAATADHIVTVSEASKRDIVELLRVPEERVSNTYETVEFPQAYLDRPEAAIANQLEGSFGLEMRGYLLFFGALEPKKNVGRLLEAYLSSGVDLPLVLVASRGWHNEAEEALLAEHAASGIEERHPKRGVRRLAHVPFSTLVNLIRGARAVVFPSLYEGFGLPVLEAMMLGTPVVTSRAGSLPEIAGDAALLVDPYDSDDIARAITTIVADADLRVELSRRGRAQADKFSLARYRERVARLYAALA